MTDRFHGKYKSFHGNYSAAAIGGGLEAKENSPLRKAIENLEAAQRQALAIRPKVEGFPYLAEALRRAGVTRNLWFLPVCQSLYLTHLGPVVTQGKPLENGTVDVPPFNRQALILALRTDQAGESSFPAFLEASWRAGVVRYEVDFTARTVGYYGCNGEEYVESYPAVEIDSATGVPISPPWKSPYAASPVPPWGCQSALPLRRRRKSRCRDTADRP